MDVFSSVVKSAHSDFCGVSIDASHCFIFSMMILIVIGLRCFNWKSLSSDPHWLLQLFQRICEVVLLHTNEKSISLCRQRDFSRCKLINSRRVDKSFCFLCRWSKYLIKLTVEMMCHDEIGRSASTRQKQ